MVLLPSIPSQLGFVKLGWELSCLVWFDIIWFGMVEFDLVWMILVWLWLAKMKI